MSKWFDGFATVISTRNIERPRPNGKTDIPMDTFCRDVRLNMTAVLELPWSAS